jgi:hypothetical protein
MASCLVKHKDNFTFTFNTFAGMENVDDEVDTNRTWESIRIEKFQHKRHKQWLDRVCSELLDQ